MNTAIQQHPPKYYILSNQMFFRLIDDMADYTINSINRTMIGDVVMYCK